MDGLLLDKLGLRPGRFRLLLATLLAYCFSASFFRNAEAASNGFGMLATNLLDVIFAIIVTWAVHSAVIRPRRPAADRVVGAICVYLLIGFAWAAIYSTIEIASPGSFRIPADLPANDASFSFLYFSFVTLATLGYGDITPVSRAAGTFAWMEAVTGQLYIAITIASLLSIAIMEKRRNDDTP